MKKFTKSRLGTAVGTAVLALSLSAPATAAVTIGDADGWQVTYSGFINLFYTQSKFDFLDGTSEKSSHLQEGLLPAFHTLTVTTPTYQGLTGTGQITFAPDSSGAQDKRLNKGGAEIDMREVFFNVDGNFGTISLGRTLSFFQRQAILKDYTLFGMGALIGAGAGGTGLGRIGHGYVYPDFRTRIAYITPEVNGFQASIGVFDPQKPAPGGLASVGTGIGTASSSEVDTPQLQGEFTYNTSWGGPMGVTGEFSAWVGALWQEQRLRPGTPSLGLTGSDKVTSWGVNPGAEIKWNNFELMGSYYTGRALGSTLFNLSGTGDVFSCTDDGAGTTSCSASKSDGFMVQGGYKFQGRTLLAGGWGQSRDRGRGPASGVNIKNTLWTVGVYHDVTDWLKLIAEYGNYTTDFTGIDKADTFSIGGFLLW